MSLIDAFRYRLRTLLRSSESDREREEEFAFHQALTEQELLRREVDAKTARHAARREFGNATNLKEEIRQMSVLRWVDALRQDLHFGARTLSRSPVFALTAVLSIGLGIGATTAIFGMVHRLLLERVAVPNPTELVVVNRVPGRYPRMFNWREYDALAQTRGVALAGFAGTYCDETEVAGWARFSTGVHLADERFFPLLGIVPAAGRLLTSADHSAASPVAVATFDFAVKYFGDSRSALGQTVKLRGASFTIVGVTPRAYRGLIVGDDYSSLTVPRNTLRLFKDDSGRQDANELWVTIIARVRSGVAGSRAAVDGVYQRCCAEGQLGRTESLNDQRQQLQLVDLSHGMPQDKADLRTEFGPVFLALLIGVSVLLLIACSNVGNLLLARAVVRSRELGVRLSLGASRGRVVRQLLVESVLLAALGAALGLTLALWGTRLLAQHLPANLVFVQSFVALQPHAVIFSFSAGITVAAVLIFGVVPALRATRLDLIAVLRESQPSSRRGKLDRGIVALQVGLALVLASSAGLLVTTLRNLNTNASVIEPDRLLTARIDLSNTAFENTPPNLLYEQTAERIRQIPGVRSVVWTTVPPFSMMGPTMARSLEMPGYESVGNDDMFAGMVFVTPDYFDAMSIALKSGRDFTAADRAGSENVTIISQSFADEFFQGRNPIGSVVRFRNDPSAASRIIGVAEDVRYYDLRAPAPRTMYFAWDKIEHQPSSRLELVIRTEGAASALLSPVLDAINATVPGVKVRIRPVSEDARLILGREESLAWLSVSFGVLAVLLAAIGLYGVMAFQVSARKREIGIRLALGAAPLRVVRMILRQSIVVIAIGVIAGVPVALIAARALGTQLYGVTPWHPAPFAVAALVLLAAGLLASFLPSRAASRFDPLVAIRSD
jgi:predicted permease